MKTYSNIKPETYVVSGNDLRINWNIKEVTFENIDGSETTQWECNEAICSVFDHRSELIEKIIGSVFDLGAEIALINNKDQKPDVYEEYQQFRVKAKELADNWLNK